MGKQTKAGKRPVGRPPMGPYFEVRARFGPQLNDDSRALAELKGLNFSELLRQITQSEVNRHADAIAAWRKEQEAEAS